MHLGFLMLRKLSLAEHRAFEHFLSLVRYPYFHWNLFHSLCCSDILTEQGGWVLLWVDWTQFIKLGWLVAAQGKELDLLQQVMVGLFTLPCQPEQSTELEKENISFGWVLYLTESFTKKSERAFPHFSDQGWVFMKEATEALRESCTHRFFRLYAQCPQILAFLEISPVNLPFPFVGFPYLKRPTQPFNQWNITALKQVLYHKYESKWSFAVSYSLL